MDEAELSDIKQTMDMIPDFLLLLESNKITVTPPLGAGKLLFFPLSPAGAKYSANGCVGITAESTT